MHGKEDRKRNRTSGISVRGRARSPAIINPDRCRWGGWQFDGSFLFIKIQRYIKRREGRREGGREGTRVWARYGKCVLSRRRWRTGRCAGHIRLKGNTESALTRSRAIRSCLAQAYYARGVITYAYGRGRNAREEGARALGVGGGFVFRCVSTEIERRVPGR